MKVKIAKDGIFGITDSSETACVLELLGYGMARHIKGRVYEVEHAGTPATFIRPVFPWKGACLCS